MAVLQVMLIAFVGMASACNTKGRNGQPPIESGSVDIPIRLQFQQGPIPSASVSVGIESKMNQNLGNGNYKQTQFNGGFELQGAAVPVLDGDRKSIKGIQADLDTHVSHDNRVVFLDHDPMRPTDKPVEAFTAQAGQQQPVQQQQQQQAVQQPTVVSAQQGKRQRHGDADEESATRQSNNVAGLKLEYFIAIMCVSGACFLVLCVVMIIVAKKKQQVVEPIRRAHGTASVYQGSVYVPTVVVDQKPPSYDSDMKSETRSSASDYEKKY